MDCVLFAKMYQVFSLEKKTTLKKYWKMDKNTGKVREFCQSEKVGTMGNAVFFVFTMHDNSKVSNEPFRFKTYLSLMSKSIV